MPFFSYSFALFGCHTRHSLSFWFFIFFFFFVHTWNHVFFSEQNQCVCFVYFSLNVAQLIRIDREPNKILQKKKICNKFIVSFLTLALNLKVINLSISIIHECHDWVNQFLLQVQWIMYNFFSISSLFVICVGMCLAVCVCAAIFGLDYDVDVLCYMKLNNISHWFLLLKIASAKTHAENLYCIVLSDGIFNSYK